MKTMAFYLTLVLASFASSVSLAASCTTSSCAKFDIPGAFPGDFYIDFLAVDFSWEFSSLTGHGSLSTESQISFHVGDSLASDPDRYAITVDPEGFQFVDLRFGVDFIYSPTPYTANVYAIGTGNGWFDAQTGDWSITIPFLLQENQFNSSHIGNLELSTLNPGGSAMILDPNDADWGKMIITSSGVVDQASGVDPELYAQLVETSGYADPTNGSLALNFAIEGIDPVAAVPLPTTAWLFGSALLSIAGLKRRSRLR